MRISFWEEIARFVLRFRTFRFGDYITDSVDYQTARKYWNKLKQRLSEEGNEPVTNCHRLKLTAADGKQRITDVADTEQLFRLIQSVTSKKSEPVKQWIARTAAARIDQLMV